MEGIGPDAGIIDKGENTTSNNSEWKSIDKGVESAKWYNIWWVKNIVFPIIVGIILWFVALIFR